MALPLVGHHWRGPESNTRVAGLVWAFFFFLIQKHHLHPAVKYFGILLGFVFLMWFNAADAPAAHPLAASEAAQSNYT